MYIACHVHCNPVHLHYIVYTCHNELAYILVFHYKTSSFFFKGLTRLIYVNRHNLQ